MISVAKVSPMPLWNQTASILPLPAMIQHAFSSSLRPFPEADRLGYYSVPLNVILIDDRWGSFLQCRMGRPESAKDSQSDP